MLTEKQLCRALAYCLAMEGLRQACGIHNQPSFELCTSSHIDGYDFDCACYKNHLRALRGENADTEDCIKPTNIRAEIMQNDPEIAVWADWVRETFAREIAMEAE